MIWDWKEPHEQLRRSNKFNATEIFGRCPILYAGKRNIQTEQGPTLDDRGQSVWMQQVLLGALMPGVCHLNPSVDVERYTYLFKRT